PGLNLGLKALLDRGEIVHVTADTAKALAALLDRVLPQSANQRARRIVEGCTERGEIRRRIRRRARIRRRRGIRIWIGSRIVVMIVMVMMPVRHNRLHRANDWNRGCAELFPILSAL